MLPSLLTDLRQTARSLGRQPGFTLLVVATLALGIGVCVIVFSVVHALLLKPLPYADPSRLVILRSVPVTAAANAASEGSEGAGLAPATVTDLQASLPTGFTAFAGSNYDFANVTRVPTPTQLTVSEVTPGYFALLGVPARLGRTLGPEDCRAAAPATVVLGDAVWRQHFGADPEIVGRTITLNDLPHTVVGVMGPGFKEPLNNAELWLPLAVDGPTMLDRSGRSLNTLARLAPGARTDTANAALAAAASNFARAYPADNGGWSLVADPLAQRLVSDFRAGLLLLLGAVGGVLLVTCVNVANLQLVRANARRREWGIRLALGAGRGRLTRQMLLESLLLAIAGGALGVLLAAWGVDGVRALLPAGYAPRQDEIALNGPVLAWAVGAVVTVGLLLGLLPALFIARQVPADVLAAGGGGRGGSGGPTGVRTRGALVVMEIAVTLVLLAGAGLLGRSFLGLLRTPPGLRTERVLSLGVSLSEQRYPDGPRRAEFYRQILENIRAVPGVANVAMASTTPFNWSLRFPFQMDGQTSTDPDAARRMACYDAVNPEFFATLDVPLRAGRAFNAGDVADANPVAIVSEGFVRRFLPAGHDPLGQHITFPNARVPTPLTIVGVAADVRRFGLEKEAPAQVYVSYLQRPTTFATLFVRAGGAGTAEALTRPAQNAVWALNPDQPITNVSTLATAIRNSVGPTRLYLALFAGFGALALGLAALGIYGTVAHAVGQRTREIGIRLALGATARDVLRLVLGQGAVLVAGGLVFGLAGALAVSRLLGNLLYGVGAGDPWTLGAVAVLLGGVALLACYLPARRATRISPVEALRQE